MRRIEQASFWFVAVFVFSFFGGRLLIAEAPNVAARADQGGVTELSTSPSSGADTAAEPMDIWTRKLREARSDDDKQAARAALRQLLATIFANDMQAREQQAQEIEARLEKLREKYKERENAKDEIIDLQLKVLEQDADGLGFPGVGSPSEWAPRAQDLPDIPPTKYHPLVPLKSFVTSPDGQLFAYVHANATSGPPEIRVYSSSTGKLLTTARADKTVGPLQFADQGIYTRETDGSLKLRIEWKKAEGHEGPLYEIGGEGAPAPRSPQAASARRPNASVGSEPPASPSRESVFSDFKLLRDQYVGAKAELQRAEYAWNAHVANAKANKPDVTIEDVKKEFAHLWSAVEDARKGFADAERLYDTKLQLLRIERESADAAYSAAKNTLERLEKLYEKNVVTISEVESQQALVQAAAREIQRVDTLYKLFQSIGTDK